MAHSTLRQQAYQQIRGLLISGELTPGSLISEPSLAERLKMSRTPVREALDQLALEGVVDRVARYGTIVRQPSRRELVEVCVVREQLESMAAAEAAEQISAADLELLRRLCLALRDIARALRNTDPPVLTEAELTRFRLTDMGFHEILLRAGGNSLIMKFVGQMQLLTRVFGFRRLPQDLRVVAHTYRHHWRIYRAIARRDPEAAAHWMRQHLRRNRERLLQCHDEYHRETEDITPLPMQSAALAALGWDERELAPHD